MPNFIKIRITLAQQLPSKVSAHKIYLQQNFLTSSLLSSTLKPAPCIFHSFHTIPAHTSSHFHFHPILFLFTGWWADCCYSQLLVSPLLELPQRTEAEAKRAQMGRGRRGEDGAPVCKDTWLDERDFDVLYNCPCIKQFSSISVAFLWYWWWGLEG